MPQATGEIVARVRKWKGLNVRETANAIDDAELTDALNFDLSEGGELIKRTGWKTVHDDAVQGGADLGANPVRILGFFNTNVFQQFVARAGSNLYTSTDGATWTIIPGGPWGNVEHGVQYTDKFYMVRRDSTIVQWDGTTATAIAGSPTGSYCKVFKDRLFVVNSYSLGSPASRIYFSNPFDFSATGWPATNYVGVGEGDGDVLVAIYNVQDYLVVFKAGATWILYVQGSDTLAWILRPFNSEIGCVAKNSIVLYEGLIYFLSVRGVYQTDGNSVRNLSMPITPFFDAIVVSSATINASSAFIWQDKYVLTLETFPVAPIWATWSTLTWASLATTPWSGSGATYNYLVYHIRQKGWTKWLPSGIQPHIFVTVILNSAIKGVYSGDRRSNGKVYKFGESRYQDDTANYEVAAETKEFDFDSPTELKNGKWVGIDMRGAGSFSLAHVVESDTRFTRVGTATGTQEEQKVRGPEYFRIWRTRLYATHENPVSLYGINLHMVKRRHMENAL